MTPDYRLAGSRLHVLDWVGSPDFISSLIEMLPPGFAAQPNAARMPVSLEAPDEARLGFACGALIDADLNAKLARWWLANPSGANSPNWDLACAAVYQGTRPALVLAEAKAHRAEFLDGRAGCGSKDPENRQRIAVAIAQARNALSAQADGVRISANEWYQFSNRIAFGWKLASEGIPTVLVYLGFTGDGAISDLYLRDLNDWRDTVAATHHIFPETLWERPIDCGRAPLWVILRSRACQRQSPSLDMRREMRARAAQKARLRLQTKALPEGA